MEDSEEHLFDRSELAGERREERNREDIEGELYGPRSEDASDSEGSLRDFLAREDEEDEAEADGPLMYAAFARERSLSPQSVLTRIRARRSRRIVVSLFFCVKRIMAASGFHSVFLLSRASSGVPIWLEPPQERHVIVEKRENRIASVFLDMLQDISVHVRS